ncbi:MAG: SapC family protein [Gammaproteobacteria bacterium]|nr:SapC family protein [Gammaproteobacteria bacterium]NNC58197.1 SapC family protein [Woeseiaceae bacterium]
MANNYVMLNNVEHQNVKVITDRSAQYGDDVESALTFPLEFRNIQSCYPIFFRKDATTGQFSPVALFGFQPRENLYLTDDGWDAHYIPLMIRRHPFLIGFQQVQDQGDTRQAVVSIDMNSPRVNETEGEALFLEHGGISDYLSAMTEMLETIRLANEMNAGFVDALLKLDLIEAVTMQVELKDRSKNELLGYYTINEDKLQQLDSESLGELHSQHYLESIFMILASMSCFRTLVEKKNDQLDDV